MDFLIELLIQILGQILVELVVEGLFKGVASVFRTAPIRVAGIVLGLAVGLLWGSIHSHDHWPILLWVSLGLAAAAVVMAVQGDDEDWRTALRLARREPIGDWRILVWPWRWPTARLLDFTAINLALAVGILIGYPLL